MSAYVNQAPEKPTGVGSYFGRIILQFIPLAGLISSIVWSCSKKNKNNRNFGIACLIGHGATVLLSILMAVVMFVAAPMILSATARIATETLIASGGIEMILSEDILGSALPPEAIEMLDAVLEDVEPETISKLVSELSPIMMEVMNGGAVDPSVLIQAVTPETLGDLVSQLDPEFTSEIFAEMPPEAAAEITELYGVDRSIQLVISIDGDILNELFDLIGPEHTEAILDALHPDLAQAIRQVIE